MTKEKCDDVPLNIYNIAKTIFEARKISAYGKNHSFKTPGRENYLHNPEADFDMAIDCAKAVIKYLQI